MQQNMPRWANWCALCLLAFAAQSHINVGTIVIYMHVVRRIAARPLDLASVLHVLLLFIFHWNRQLQAAKQKVILHKAQIPTNTMTAAQPLEAWLQRPAVCLMMLPHNMEKRVALSCSWQQEQQYNSKKHIITISSSSKKETSMCLKVTSVPQAAMQMTTASCKLITTPLVLLQPYNMHPAATSSSSSNLTSCFSHRHQLLQSRHKLNDP
jgi:hypothetical protein